MDEILKLLTKIGASEELAKGITEAIDSHLTAQRALLAEEYDAKKTALKKVMVEEVEKYKKDLARKTQIFFESRADKIESQIAKQVAIKDAAAEGKLKQVKALLEGIQLDTEGNAEPGELHRQIETLVKQNTTLKEEKTAALQKAGKATLIAQKALEKNRQFSAILESRQAAPIAAPVAPAPVAPVETKPAPTTVVESVQGSTPAKVVEKKGSAPTTATPILESTVAKPAPKTGAAVSSAPVRKEWDPNSIASMME